MTLQRITQELKKCINVDEFDVFLKGNIREIQDYFYELSITELKLEQLKIHDFYFGDFKSSQVFYDFDEHQNTTETFNSFLIILASTFERLTEQIGLTAPADNIVDYLPKSSLKFRLEALSKLNNIDNRRTDYINLFTIVLDLLEKAENEHEEDYTQQILDLLVYYYNKGTKSLLKYNHKLEQTHFKSLFENIDYQKKYPFLGHYTLQELIAGKSVLELLISEDYKAKVLYPSNEISKVFRELIVSPVMSDEKTTGNLRLGIPSYKIRPEVLNYGKTDFRVVYKGLTLDEKVLLYCFFNMRKHYFTSYAVFSKLYDSVQNSFHNKKPVFIDLGCGPLTSGLALADLYYEKTQNKINFAYIGIDIAKSMLDKAEEFSEIELFHEDCSFNFYENWNDIPNNLLRALAKGNNPIFINASYLFASTSLDVRSLVKFVQNKIKIFKNVHFIFQNPSRSDRNVKYEVFKQNLKFIQIDEKIEQIFYKTNSYNRNEPSKESVYYEILTFK